jgi:hypothetical protein
MPALGILEPIKADATLETTLRIEPHKLVRSFDQTRSPCLLTLNATAKPGRKGAAQHATDNACAEGGNQELGPISA